MAIISPLTSTGKATGGAIEESDIDGTTYTLHTFLSTGVFQVGADNITGVDVLVVGGGGGGGGHEGGGGGGGGVIHIENRTLTAGVAYSCRVGIGGFGGLYDPSGFASVGSSGERGGDSYFGTDFTVRTDVAYGGGGGGNYNNYGHNRQLFSVDWPPGSRRFGSQIVANGGGTGSIKNAAFGGEPGAMTVSGDATAYGNYWGGYVNVAGGGNEPAGGGGGAGAAGGDITSIDGAGGAGGAGVRIDIDGNNYYWAGGGGGSARDGGAGAGAGGAGGGGGGNNYGAGDPGAGGGTALNNGTAGGNQGSDQTGNNGGTGGQNTGGGGGGGTNGDSGGRGGDGIIIIRYET